MITMSFGLPVMLFAQHKKPSRKELNKNRIDALFSTAKQQGLTTDSILRYEFLFSDRDLKRLEEFSTRMRKDSFEVYQLHQVEKIWKLILYKNVTFSRKEMYAEERCLRGLKYRYYVDHYLGFSIHPADPDPVSVSDHDFSTYLKSLSDEQLYWVGKRLLDLKMYGRVRFAFEAGLQRKYKQDTTHYRYGLALVAVNEPNDGINQWKRAVKINPGYTEVLMALGKIHFENGYFEEALDYYQRADKLLPANSLILLHIGETLFALKQYNQSYSYAKRSHQLDRKNVFTKSLLELLNEPRVKYLKRKFPDK